MTVDVAIIGGGISGLATAYALKLQGLDVVVLERQTRSGGNAQTERFGGFQMEHGPSTVNAAITAAARLSGKLGLDDSRCDLGDGVKNRYLVSGGNLSGISTKPMRFLKSNYISLPGRLRMMAEFMLPHQLEGEDETVMSFCSRRFGREFAEQVIDPMVAGIYAGKATELSVSAVFPKLVALEREFGSVSLGMFRRYQQGAKMPGSRLYSWRDGIGALPRALTAHLGHSIRTGVAVRRVRRCAEGFQIDAGGSGQINASAVVIATQAHVAARFLDGLDDAAAAAAGEIKAPPLAVVFLGYKLRQVDHPLDGLGFLVPQSENLSLNGAQFSSTMFPGRAPEGCVAVTGYYGGARAPDLARLAETDLVALARQEFGDLIGARGAPVVSKVRHWPMGLPQYEVGHLKRTACLRDAEQRQPGLFLTGNYFNGPAVGACLDQAEHTAKAATAHLAEFADTLSGIKTESVRDVLNARTAV
jgi:oxygen-dependent protoporphyrinogen oxidase